PPCWTSPSRPDEPTRSGCTCPPFVIRASVIRRTAPTRPWPGDSGWSGSGCTPWGSASSTRGRATTCSPRAPIRRTCSRRSIASWRCPEVGHGGRVVLRRAGIRRSRWGIGAGSFPAPGAASVDLAVPALPVGGTQLELLQLAGRGAGQLVAELHGRRRLVAGDPLLAPGDDVRLGRRAALGEDDERLDRLAPLLAGHADDGDLGDVRVGEDDVLDLDGGDVLPAGDDDVLPPVADRDVAVLADAAAVAGVEPAAGEDALVLVGEVEIALHDDVASGEHLTRLRHR